MVLVELQMEAVAGLMFAGIVSSVLSATVVVPAAAAVLVMVFVVFAVAFAAAVAVSQVQVSAGLRSSKVFVRTELVS